MYSKKTLESPRFRLPRYFFLPGFIKHALTTVALTCFVALRVAAQQGPQLDLERVKISAGMYVATAQVAATSQQRQIGLMFRIDMQPHEGMLFVFEQPAKQCFWMKNTPLALTAAFVADDGRIVNLVDMKPQALDVHCSNEPVRYVLEMNKGWFEKRAIKAGAMLKADFFQKIK